MKGLLFSPVITQGLFVGPNRRMGSSWKGSARWFNKESPEAAFLNHVDRPFKQPEIGHVVVMGIRQIQHWRHTKSKLWHVAADYPCSTINFHKVKVEQRWLERSNRNKILSKIGLRHKLLKQRPHRRIKLCVGALFVSMPPKVLCLMLTNLSPSEGTRPGRGVGCIQPRVILSRNVCENKRGNSSNHDKLLGTFSLKWGNLVVTLHKIILIRCPNRKRNCQPSSTSTVYTKYRNPIPRQPCR